MMAPNTRRLAGSAGANAAVGAFAVAAASHGTTGLIIGAIVVTTTALLDAIRTRVVVDSPTNKIPPINTDTSPGANP